MNLESAICDLVDSLWRSSALPPLMLVVSLFYALYAASVLSAAIKDIRNNGTGPIETARIARLIAYEWKSRGHLLSIVAYYAVTPYLVLLFTLIAFSKPQTHPVVSDSANGTLQSMTSGSAAWTVTAASSEKSRH